MQQGLNIGGQLAQAGDQSIHPQLNKPQPGKGNKFKAQVAMANADADAAESGGPTGILAHTANYLAGIPGEINTKAVQFLQQHSDVLPLPLSVAAKASQAIPQDIQRPFINTAANLNPVGATLQGLQLATGLVHDPQETVYQTLKPIYQLVGAEQGTREDKINGALFVAGLALGGAHGASTLKARYGANVLPVVSEAMDHADQVLSQEEQTPKVEQMREAIKEAKPHYQEEASTPPKETPTKEAAPAEPLIAPTAGTNGPSETVRLNKPSELISETKGPVSLSQTVKGEAPKPIVEPTPEKPVTPFNESQNPEVVTQGKNAATAREREIMGSDKLPGPERVKWSENLQNAKDQKLDEVAHQTAQDINNGKRKAPLNADESAGMTLRLAQIKADYVAARIKQELAIEAGNHGEQQKWGSQADNLFNQHDDITRALKKTGTDTARALAIRNLGIDTDFNEASVLQRARTRKEAPLTPVETKQFQDYAKQIQDLQDQLREATKAQSEPAIRSNPRNAPRTKTSILSGNKTFTLERLTKSKAELEALQSKSRNAIRGKSAGAANIDPAVVRARAKVIYEHTAAYVEAGVRGFPRFMVALRANHPDVANLASIEEWKAAHDRAKLEYDAQNPPEKKGLPADQQAVVKEFQAAREARDKALGENRLSEKQSADLQRAAQQTKAEAMAKADAKVKVDRRMQAKAAFDEQAAKQRTNEAQTRRQAAEVHKNESTQQRSDYNQAVAEEKAARQAEKAINDVRQKMMDQEYQKSLKQRRQEIRQAFAQDEATKRANQKAYDREYKNRANEAEDLAHEAQSFHEMNTTGVDIKDIGHQGAVERFVGRLMDSGASLEQVQQALKQRAPNADPYRMAQLTTKAVGAYKARFNVGKSVAENYLERGGVALQGNDVVSLRRQLEQTHANTRAAEEAMRPPTWHEKAGNAITMSILSRTAFIAKMAGQAAGRVIFAPWEIAGSKLLNIAKVGDQSMAELAPSETSTLKGMGAGAKAAGQEIHAAIWKPDESLMRNAIKGNPSRIRVEAGEQPHRTGMPSTSARTEIQGVLANPVRLHEAAQSLPMTMDQAAAYTNGIDQANKAGVNTNDPIVQAQILETASKVALERASRNPTIFRHVAQFADQLTRSNDPKVRTSGVVLKGMTVASNFIGSHLAKAIDASGVAPLRAAGGLIKANLADEVPGPVRGVDGKPLRVARGFADAGQAESVARAIKRTPWAVTAIALVTAAPAWLKIAGLGSGKNGPKDKDGKPMTPGSIEWRGHMISPSEVAAIPGLSGMVLLQTSKDAVEGRTSWQKTVSGYAKEVPGVRAIGQAYEGDTRSLIQSAIPASGIMRQAAEHFDQDPQGNPMRRQQTSPIQQAQAVIPGLRNKLPPSDRKYMNPAQLAEARKKAHDAARKAAITRRQNKALERAGQ